LEKKRVQVTGKKKKETLEKPKGPRINNELLIDFAAMIP